MTPSISSGRPAASGRPPRSKAATATIRCVSTPRRAAPRPSTAARATISSPPPGGAGSVAVTLGAGRDTLYLEGGALQPGGGAIAVADFATGAGGDVVDMALA